MTTERPAAGRPTLLWSALVLLLAALAIVGPLLCGLPVPGYLSGLDGNFALELVRASMESLRAGVWFPRWLPGGNLGLGSPAFYFYGRLPFFCAAVLGVTLRLQPVAALLGALALFRALAFFGCRLWLRQHTAACAADCGALFFVVVPFAMLLDPVTRIGFAETAAVAFVPLLFWFLDVLLAGRCGWLGGLLALSALYAALACTHLPQLVLSFGVATLYLLLHRSRQVLLLHTTAFALGATVAAASLLPALCLQGTINASAWSDNPYVALRNNFLFTKGRFALYRLYSLDAELYATWLLCAAALLLARQGWAAARKNERQSMPAHSQKPDRRFFALGGSLGVTLLAMTGLARPLWLALPALRVIQFPWRLFPMTIALSAGVLALWAHSRPRQRACLLAAGGLVLLQMAFAAAGWRLPRDHAVQHHGLRLALERMLPAYAGPGQRANATEARVRSFVPEYLPAAAHKAGWRISRAEDRLSLPGVDLPGVDLASVDLAGVALAGIDMPGLHRSAPTTAPLLQVTVLPDGSIRLRGILQAPRRVLLPVFFYPDERVTGSIQATVTPDAATGLASVRLPAGAVLLQLEHTRPLPAVRAGDRLSALGTLIWLFCLPWALHASRRVGQRSHYRTPVQSRWQAV